MKRPLKKRKKIALIQGGIGPEREISLMSAKAVAKALDELNYDYFPAPADSDLPSLLISQKPDLAFLALHGLYGEDGLIQSLCEFLKIPYTGSGVLASSFCMNKIFFKKFLLIHKFPTPEFQVLRPGQTHFQGLSYPLIVKPSHGGSSLGTCIVKREKEMPSAIQKAWQIGAGVFIEKYLPACREIAVSVVDGQILTPIEVSTQGGFYDYKRKYKEGESSYFIPPRIEPALIEKIKFMAEKLFQVLDLRSYARADFLLEKENTVWILEVNTLPGLTELSLLPKSAGYDGIDFTSLIQKIIQMADRDYQL